MTINGKHLEKRGAVFSECTSEEINYFRYFTGEEDDEDEEEEGEGGEEGRPDEASNVEANGNSGDGRDPDAEDISAAASSMVELEENEIKALKIDAKQVIAAKNYSAAH